MVATAALATVAIGASLGLWAMSRTTRPTDRPLMRFDVDLGPDAASGWPSSVAISPDGTRLVFPVRNTSVRRPRLATRLLDQTTVTHMPGTEGARGVFFSPDSRWIGFFADGKLKKMPVQGGAPIVLCDAPLTFGASWGEDGYVVLSGSTGAGAGLARVSADGGQPEPLSRNQPGEFLQMLPQVFQGGNAVLFSNLASINATSDATIDVLDLKAGVKKTILSGAYFGRYVASAGPLGHLVYIRGEDLFGVGFDPVRLELQGTPELLVQGVGGGSLSQDFGSLTFSQSGIFVYPSGQGTQTYPIVWLDSSGKTTPLLPKPGAYFTPRLSPDGQRLAVTVGSDRGRDIWVYDHARDIMTRLTLDERSRDAIWTPDGKHLLYWTSSPNNSTISVIRADGAGEPQQLLESKNYVVPSSVSPDGRRLLYFEVHPETRQDLWTLPLDVSDSDHFKPGKPEPFLRTPLLEFEPSFSSDGRWIAYRSNESDANTTEVYVRPYPGPGGKWQVSNGGGKGPIWSRNGKELFYETLDGRIMVVDYVTKGEAFEAGRPRQWSDQRILSLGGAFDADLAFDGRRFVVFPPSESNGADRGAVRVTFLVNFFDELRRRLPLAGR